jgi:hypothetical protein
MLSLLVGATLAATALASYGSNLNYRSPSLHHPGLGINLRKVVKRSNPASKWSKDPKGGDTVLSCFLRISIVIPLLLKPETFLTENEIKPSNS